MSPFEVVHSYKPRKLLDDLPMSPYARLFESFVRRVQDLHVEITKQIQASNVQYKLQVDVQMTQ
jgi:hypothetical protein